MPASAGKLPLVCLDLPRLERGKLLGFASISNKEIRFTLRHVAIHETSGQRWAPPPPTARISQDRQLSRDADGLIRYAPIGEFYNTRIADAFSAAVIRAGLKFHAHRGRPSPA